jgi:predicted ABC-type transport system involved in lysophospholipase L1 biosynthesis ATPase subunit
MVSLLAFDRVRKRHQHGGRERTVFDCIDLEVRAGDSIGVWGAPRAGKSSLLRLAAGIELADAGAVRFQGQDFAQLRGCERASLLRSSIGFAPALGERMPPGLDRSEDVLRFASAPLLSDGWSQLEAEQRAAGLLERVGTLDCAYDAPYELSAGQRTRVALARALVREPTLLLVDEPGISTSPSERSSIGDLLRSLGRELACAMIVVSVDAGMLRGLGRIFSAGDGRLLSADRPGSVVPFPRPPQGQDRQ